MLTNDIETFYKNMEIHDKRKIERLEKEIEELKEQLENDIDRYEDTISYQLGVDKGKEYMQQKIDKAIEILKDTNVDMPSTLLIEIIDYARQILEDKE